MVASVLLACALFAQDSSAKITPVKWLKVYDLDVGQVGPFPEEGTSFYFEVYRVLGPKEMLVQFCSFEIVGGRRFTNRDKVIAFSGIATKDLADGKKIALTKIYEVTGTKKIGVSTYHVLTEASGKSLDEFSKAAEVWLKELKEKKPTADPKAAKKRVVKKPKADPPAVDHEAAAASALKLIKQLLADGKTEAAKYRLQQFEKKYPGTKAAEEAKHLLDDL